MIITCIHGGLGNQLFMYACGYAAARRLGTKLMLDTSYFDTQTLRDFELDKLNVKYDRRFSTEFLKFYPLKVAYRKAAHACIFTCYKRIIEDKKARNVYDKRFDHLINRTYIKGFWQTEKYFKEYREDLIVMMNQSYEVSVGCKSYIDKVRKCNSLAVHVRRGDYIRVGVCLEPSYYYKALDIADSTLKNPIHFVFSDDIEYCRELFKNRKGEYVYIEYDTENSTVEDLFIMKNCRNIITANSSYSWWAAWLNDNPSKLVICPQYWSKGNFYPEEWVKI